MKGLQLLKSGHEGRAALARRFPRKARRVKLHHPLVAELVGPKHPALEVGAMNSLTVNLHMLMAAFYRPSDGRAAIIIEAGAFPSDRYAVGSQIRHHGRDPSEWLIEIQPR